MFRTNFNEHSSAGYLNLSNWLLLVPCLRKYYEYNLENFCPYNIIVLIIISLAYYLGSIFPDQDIILLSETQSKAVLNGKTTTTQLERRCKFVKYLISIFIIAWSTREVNRSNYLSYWNLLLLHAPNRAYNLLNPKYKSIVTLIGLVGFVLNLNLILKVLNNPLRYGKHRGSIYHSISFWSISYLVSGAMLTWYYNLGFTFCRSLYFTDPDILILIWMSFNAGVLTHLLVDYLGTFSGYFQNNDLVRLDVIRDGFCLLVIILVLASGIAINNLKVDDVRLEKLIVLKAYLIIFVPKANLKSNDWTYI